MIWRRARLELRLALNPTVWLVPAALVLLALMHTGLGGGAAVWARHWVENAEAFVPIAFGIMSAPLLLVEADEHTWEMNGMLPVPRVAGVRLLAVVGGGWLVTLLWLAVLRVAFGPVPFWNGVLAALGPGLFLGGLAAWVAARTARVAMGYLMAVGVPVADLVLKLLGGFQVLWPLQLLDVFAYRWMTPLPPWWVVKVVMAAGGLYCYAMAIRHWRQYGIGQL
jgi:hypothetical protein